MLIAYYVRVVVLLMFPILQGSIKQGRAVEKQNPNKDIDIQHKARCVYF